MDEPAQYERVRVLRDILADLRAPVGELKVVVDVGGFAR